ncbi:head decoration protein [Devosia faecipullorum]|uniref:head decoration protein n=1 Tax=Devosia faecipullorum TaxID=2755039 RepID=UPI00187B2B29|nr:head decoration protein [Devosia faecipullorum]MBE7732167.1 head decoration protein [Devosia faecipullorum]
MAEYEPTYGASPSYSSYETSYDEIDTGQIPLISEPITILAGAGKLPRGAVLGKVTLTGKYVLSKASVGGVAVADGSQVPAVVLAHGVDASGAADIKSAGYVHGQFIWQGLTVGEGHDFDTLKAAWAGTTRFLVKAA